MWGSGALLLAAVISRHLAIHAGWFGAAWVLYYLIWLWLPTRIRTWPVNLLLGMVAALGLALASTLLHSSALTQNLLYPDAVFLAVQPGPGVWLWISGASLLAAGAFMTPNSATMFSHLLTLSTLFAVAYLLHLRRRARELDRQRTEELRLAYKSLQSTHQQLVDATAAIAEARAREERLRIAADIHDGVGHRLTSLIVGLESLELMLDDDLEAARTRVPTLLTTARQALGEVREAVHARETSGDDWDRRTFDALVQAAAVDGQ